jgi:hypothetical protein
MGDTIADDNVLSFYTLNGYLTSISLDKSRQDRFLNKAILNSMSLR